MTGPDRTGLGLPLLIGLAAFVLFLGFQAIQLLRERSVLATIAQAQDAPVSEGDRARRQLESLLSGTAKHAHDGDTAAKGVMDGLAKQGINYNPSPLPIAP